MAFMLHVPFLSGPARLFVRSGAHGRHGVQQSRIARSGIVDIPYPLFHRADPITPPVAYAGHLFAAGIPDTVLLQHSGRGLAEYFAVHLSGGLTQPALKQEKRRGFTKDFVRDTSAPETMRILRQPIQQRTDAGGF